MAAYIQELEDTDGNKIYPITKADAVYDDNGNALSDREFKLPGFSITGTDYEVRDTRIKSDSVVDIYFKDPTYDINPTYTLSDGLLTITLDSAPESAIEVSTVVVKNL